MARASELLSVGGQVPGRACYRAAELIKKSGQEKRAKNVMVDVISEVGQEQRVQNVMVT
jgi:hypothetical protein